MKSFLALVLLALFCSVALSRNVKREVAPAALAPRNAEGRTDVDWYKALNNLISVASHNLLVSGEFLALYPFSSLLRVPEKNSCNRELNFDPTETHKFRGPLEEIYETGVFKIGVSSVVSLPYFSNSTGSPIGFFFDLGNSMANEMGFILKRTLRAEFHIFPTTNFFANATQALANGKAHAIIGMSYLVPRTLLTDYSCWYETPSPFAVYRDETYPLPSGFTLPTTISGWNNPQIKVATLLGSIFETAARRYLPNCQFVGFPTMNDAYDSVGVSTDIVFSIIGETEGYNEAHGMRLTIQPNTIVTYGGGNAFATHKVF